MKIILAVDAIHSPLTGIGRYTWEILQGLKASPAITDMKLFSHGRWVDKPQNLLVPVPAGSSAAAPARATVRKVMANSRLVTTAYGALMPTVARWRLRKYRDYLFHSPNFFLPPCPGRAVATFHDLSIYDHPEFHPDARVAFMHSELPRALRRADALITVSEFTRQRIIDHFGWPHDRIHTVLSGVDHSQYAAVDPVQASKTLDTLGIKAKNYTLCVSTIEPRKNLEQLIRAYGRLPDSMRKACPLVIVGDRGWRSEQTHALIKSCAKAGWLHYYGYLPQKQLPAVLANCALFVFPSLYEGFGLPVLEAMASGVPVLSSDIAPVREFAGTTIRYFDPHDEESITASLHSALNDSQWRQAAGEQARRQSQEFTWTKTVEQLIQIYARYATP